MGKTAVFVLATLQQLEPVDGVVSVLVMCHTRELAFQISKEYERFSKYMPTVKVSRFHLSEILLSFLPVGIYNDENSFWYHSRFLPDFLTACHCLSILFK